MHALLLALAGPFVNLAGILTLAYIAHRATRPSDAERAALLSQLANDAAAAVLAANPGRPWADLLALVVQRMCEGHGIPTNSAVAIEKAAAGALATRMGAGNAGR